MPNCCVPTCKSGYLTDMRRRKELGLKNPSFFRINEKNLKEFSTRIGREDRALTLKDIVCSEHFDPQDIIWYHPDLLINGILIKGEKRGAPMLAEGAVPKVFKHRSSASTKKSAAKSTEEKAAPKRRLAVKQKSASDAEPKDNGFAQEQSKPNRLETLEMKVDVSKIDLPNKAWAVHYLPNEIVFAKIGSNLKITHSVILKQMDSVEVEVEVGGVRVHRMTMDDLTSLNVRSIIYSAEEMECLE